MHPVPILWEVRCDLEAEGSAWESAPDVVREARRFSEVGGFLALPAFADRLEGRAALAAGRTEEPVSLLRRAIDRFAEIGARWERACTDLTMATAQLQADDRQEASASLDRAVPILEDLSSLRELKWARALASELVESS